MAYRVEIAKNAEADLEEPVRVLNYGRKPHIYRIFFTVDDMPDELKGD